jgi:hypothetical protein
MMMGASVQISMKIATLNMNPKMQICVTISAIVFPFKQVDQSLWIQCPSPDRSNGELDSRC